MTRGDTLKPLIDHMSVVPDRTAQRRLIEDMSAVTRPTILSFLNSHAFNLACASRSFRHDLLGADILLRDGIGMAILFKLLGRSPGENMNGTDLIPELLAGARTPRVALIGSREPYLGQAAAALARRGVDVALTDDGFRSAGYYGERLSRARCDLILLGMGMPKQERVAELLRARATHPCLIVNGGAIIDFLAGRVPRAPRLMRRLGLEWLYRLTREPARLASRYLVGNPVFLLRALRLGLLLRPGRPSIAQG